VLRVGVLVGFFILGGGLYAKENGMLFSASSSNPATAASGAVNEVADHDAAGAADNTNVCEDVRPYQEQITTLKNSNKKNLESLSEYRKRESAFNRQVSQLESSNEAAEINILELKDIVSSSKAQITELEKAKKDALNAVKNAEKTEAKLQELERQKQLADVAIRESEAAAIICDERLKDVQLDVRSLRTQSETSAEALKMCISKLDERQRGDKAVLASPSSLDQQAVTSKENRRHPVRRFIVSALIGALVASIVPTVVSMALGSGAATTAAVATKATKAAKTTRVVTSAQGVGGRKLITNIPAALIAFVTGAFTIFASGFFR